MRIEMKKILLIVTLYVCCAPSFSQESENRLVMQLQLIKQQHGDSIARCYLDSKKDSLEQRGESGSYLFLWGLLTSNMWNSKPSEALRIEYKNYLDSVVDEEINSESYMPDQVSLPTIWQLTRDYYLMLYREGDREKALTILKNIHRWFKPYQEMRNTVGYAQSLLDLCLLLVRDMHKYEEGSSFVEEYAEVTKNVYGDNSAQYAVALNNLCYLPSKSLEEKKELLSKAISIYEVAEYQDPAMLDLMKTTYKSVISAMTGRANTDSINGESNGILPVNDCISLIVAERGSEALESLNYYKSLLLNDKYLDTLRYAEIVGYIITANIQINELAKAQKEIDDFQSVIGIDNIPPSYSEIFYSSAGLIAMRLKDYPKALRYSHAACRLLEQINKYDIEYCKILGNISLIYGLAAESINKEYYIDAKWYIDESISVFEENVGKLEQHGSTGLTLLNNKAYIYEAIGDRQESIKIYEKIVSDYVNNEDVKNAWLLAANNLAALYVKGGNSEKAISLLESLSSKNKEYKQIFAQNLALLYYSLGDKKTRNALVEYNTITYDNCMDVFNFFTVSEREDYWTRNARELLLFNNLVADKYPEMADIAFDNLLFVKNLKLMSADILKKMVENSSDEDLKKKYNRILSLRDAISYRSNEKDSIEIWSSMLNEEERSILSLVPDYKEKLLGAFHSWSEIKAALKNDEVAVDFTYAPKMKDWDHVDGYYGAFVITKDSNFPKLVTLCEVDSINKLFIGTTPDAQQISMLYKESTPIYKRVWGNLEEYIKGKKTIYFSPTGQLNLLNHDALIMPDGNSFGDRYNLVRLSSTDKIISSDTQENIGNYQSAVVYGGILYDLSVADMNEAAKKYKPSHDENFLLAMRSEDERGRWNYLPGTKAESESIYKLLTSSNVRATLLQAGAANEESFKSMNGHSPNIIHLSTHGFFLDTSEKVKANPFMSKVGNYSEKEDQLIRTGLLMAGSNNVWCGREQVSGIEDGILTADEISRLDLSGTDLVVLSACETAKGQVDEIDGVLGLQRGFKKAGAKSILMSLWKVSDAVTSMLMTQFYTNLGKGMNKHDALKTASRTIRGQYSDPYYWASWVFLDAVD